MYLLLGVEESIVNAPLITDQLFKSNLTFCIFCVFSLQTAFTIDSSTPTLKRNRFNLNEHPIHVFCVTSTRKFPEISNFKIKIEVEVELEIKNYFGLWQKGVCNVYFG
jgi:hypothetical protein